MTDPKDPKSDPDDRPSPRLLRIGRIIACVLQAPEKADSEKTPTHRAHGTIQ